MTKIIVDIDKLYNYSKELNQKAQEFSKITKKMEEIVIELEKNWSGSDATKFRTNAVSYINNLKKVENSLIDSSVVVRGNVTHYNDRVSKFTSIIG